MLHSVGLSTGSIGVGGFSFSAFLIGVDCSSLSVSSSSLRIIYQLEHHIAYTCNTIEIKQTFTARLPRPLPRGLPLLVVRLGRPLPLVLLLFLVGELSESIF